MPLVGATLANFLGRLHRGLTAQVRIVMVAQIRKFHL
jgi:hypothetical protein